MNRKPRATLRRRAFARGSMRSATITGLSFRTATIVHELLQEAPTLSAEELSAYLGITLHQSSQCIAAARRQW